jgi:hypothetical protein
MKKETMVKAKVLKKNLFLGILFDAVGMLSLRCLWRVFRCHLGTDGSIFDDQNV